MSFIVKTRTCESRTASFSRSSRFLMPTSTVCAGRTFGENVPIFESSEGSGPSSAARGIPCTLPDSEVAGVFISPCASSQRRPIGRFLVLRAQSATAATEPAARLWSPPSTIGIAPSSSEASDV